jgi:transcriptional regulator with XRE-family HTH domain
VAARQQLGFSQIQMAEKLGVTQQTYAGWERRTTALRPDHLSKLASILNVSAEYLLGHQNGPKRKGGPVGRARRVFEEVSKIPRHKQQRILGVVEDLLMAHQASTESTTRSPQ